MTVSDERLRWAEQGGDLTTVHISNVVTRDEVKSMAAELLRLRAAGAGGAAQAGDGWVLVPRDPNTAMIYAGRKAVEADERHDGLYVSDAYRAMIGAAPTSPEQPTDLDKPIREIGPEAVCRTGGGWGVGKHRSHLPSAKVRHGKTLPERIDDVLNGSSRGYDELLRALWPDPQSHRYSSNGGPPGCTMALSAALRRGGFRVTWGRHSVIGSTVHPRIRKVRADDR